MMRAWCRFRVAVSVLLLVLFVSACGTSSSKTATPTTTANGPSAASSRFTVGLVTDVGGLNDKSFNHDAYLGLIGAEKKYGIKGKVIESKSPADYVPNLTHFAQQHVNLTIAVGFLMQSAIYQVASQFPSAKFAIIDGAPANAKGATVNLANVSNLFYKEQEAGYLVGVVSGLMEKQHIGKAKRNAIGYMGGLSIPPVNRYIAGYVAGARSVDPGIRILSGYSQSFTDQGRGKAIGLTQIAQGADILFQVAGASGLGYLAAAQQRGVYGIGADADQGYLGSFVITSALKRVDVAVETTIRSAQLGHFKGGDHLFGLSNNGTGFVASKVIPPSIVTQVRGIERKMASGQIIPPATIH